MMLSGNVLIVVLFSSIVLTVAFVVLGGKTFWLGFLYMALTAVTAGIFSFLSLVFLGFGKLNSFTQLLCFSISVALYIIIVVISERKRRGGEKALKEKWGSLYKG